MKYREAKVKLITEGNRFVYLSYLIFHHWLKKTLFARVQVQKLRVQIKAKVYVLLWRDGSRWRSATPTESARLPLPTSPVH